MNVFKSYSSKSAANKAAKKAGQEAIEQDGKWGIMVPASITLAEAKAEAESDEALALSGNMVEVPVVNGVALPIADNDEAYDAINHGLRDYACPHCGIHLDNGVSSDSDETPNEKFEHMCLGCGAEFGRPIPPRGKPAIISDLPLEQHGVKRPQRAGLCWQVWELAFKLQANSGTLPTVAQMREAAPHLNPTNVQIEFYNWRKYNGIRGRQ